MRRATRWIGFILILAMMQTSAVVAQDVKGARDHPLVKRFPGSTIVRYEKRNSTEYTLPTGPLLKWDYARSQPDFGGKKLDLEGDVTRFTYVVRPGPSAGEVFGGYKSDLAAKGFKPLYEARGATIGRSQGNLYQNLAGQLLEYSPKGAHFLSVQLDVVEVKPVSDKLVVVSASEISRGLETAGRVALYGILFDSNKADIKAESRPALEEIAKFLRSTPNAKLDVVGHTDNVGSYDSNLDLSRARAMAVVGILVKEYDLNPQRLRASGVGFLAPIASNAAEEGRAKNRRVELLPQ